MQTQMQQFLNVISNVQNTPPEHANDALAHIRQLYVDMPDQQAYSFALFRGADHIMKLKQFNEQIQWLIEQCIYDVILRAVESDFKVGTQALRCIFDTGCDYYKHNNLDASLKFPLGMIRKLEWYQPEVGKTVDVVKPQITQTSFCCWTRGVLLSKENKKYTVKFENTETPVTNSVLPWFDVAGSRTPDHDWRIGINVEDHIDAYNKFWYPSTVVQSGVENGAKRVSVTFRRFSEKGEKVDSKGNHYDGLGINQDDWIDIFCCRIERPNKMCFSCATTLIIVSRLQLRTLMSCFWRRNIMISHFKDQFHKMTVLLALHEQFCDLKGYEVLIEKVRGKDINIDNFTNMMLIFGHLSVLIPRMGLTLYLPILLYVAIDYVKQNNQHFHPYRLDCFSFFYENTAKRLYSLSQKHIILNNLHFLVQSIQNQTLRSRCNLLFG